MEDVLKNQVQLLHWSTDVTLKNVDEFRGAVQKLVDGEKAKLILELTEVAYLNSAALGVIADAVLGAGRTGKELIIAGVQSTVGEIFEIVHFSSLMKIFTEIDEGYIYFAGEME
ncbi:STAS domain-containing protein [Paenibacillus sp. sgz5001063]|uniref:STAS domain-containing protein n=1 Tax=Paenibacillus sp. sgz5001063 TaxID=3242474 RepID=UPI0036D24C92